MSAPSLRSAGLICLALGLALPAAAATIDPADQARIEQEAVKAYIAKTDAEKIAASDKLVAKFADALLNDPGSAVMGNPNGDVTIVQFFDYNCGFTQRAEPRVEALLKSDPGVKLILKEFTIEPVESSPIAGRAALASVRQGKYAAYHMQMLSVPGRKMKIPEIFEQAKLAGLDVERLKKDMEAPEYYTQIVTNLNLARSLRIFQTPTFIVDGHIITQPSAEIDFPRLVAQVRASRAQAANTH